MPIDFKCPSCSKLLRVPDEAAGRQAKCPQCGNVVVVPAAGQPKPPITPSGPPSSFPPSQPPVPPPPSSSGPLSDDDEFRVAPPTPTPKTPTSSYRPAGDNPFASPAPAAREQFPPMVDGDGPPWESEGPSVGSFIATVKLVVGSPSEMFSTMRTEGGLGLPIGFVVVGGWIGQAFSTLYNLGSNMFMGEALPRRGGAPNPFEVGGASAGVAIGTLVIMPLFIMIGMFITSGIYHVMLMMLDGAKKPYETTARVYAYAVGSTSLFLVIPCLGPLIAGIANMVYIIIGLSKAHGISGGKAAAAVLLPIVICCGCAIAGFALIGFTAQQAGR